MIFTSLFLHLTITCVMPYIEGKVIDMIELEKLTRDDLVSLVWEEETPGPVTMRTMSILSEYFGWTPAQILQRGVTRLVIEEHPNQGLVSEVLG